MIKNKWAKKGSGVISKWSRGMISKWGITGIGKIRGMISKWSITGLCTGGISMILFAMMFIPMAEGATKKKKIKKRVVIDFQDELLEGNVSNPSIFHLFHKKQLRYGRLIKFRKNFLPEMRRTAREIK